ncbi:DUF2971 domain-containing protein [Saccharicrinis aurantiacus]|uniref:DUF2971 domain-containing protein n=1 Tax=Saccharicrinis aurantiacus TaxID=1849719 RepID=UPI002492BFDC|nr:DUF2971 domain-containing protein [Saccharicrinis aurantiacus]
MYKDKLKQEYKELIDNFPIIYKYVDFKGAQEIISNGTLLIKNPAYFNDPYDCHPKLICYDNLPEQYLKDLINKQFPNLSRQERRKKQLEAIRNSKEPLIDLFKNDFALRERYLKGVTCFSKKKLDILMWSMYADSHKGLCVGFNFEKLYRSLKSQNEFNEVIPLFVKYSKVLKSNCFFEDSFKAVVEWLRTKSIDWKYEDEIRFAFGPFNEYKSNTGLVSFNLDAIEELYFGYNMDPKEEQTIVEQINSKNIKCQQFKISLNDTEYKLGAKEKLLIR